MPVKRWTSSLHENLKPFCTVSLSTLASHLKMRITVSQKVLIVDDNDDTVTIIRTVLEREGYLVVTAMDGIEGIEKARKELPDLIVLDLMMPRKNGFEVCQALKERSETKEIPILILSAKIDSVSRERTSALGAQEHLTKPINPALLLKKIKQYLPSIPETDPLPEHRSNHF